MTGDTLWTVIGIALCLFLLTLCAGAMVNDHLRAKRTWQRHTADALALVNEQAGRPVHCGSCRMDILDVATHMKLYHAPRIVGPEDQARWSA